MAGQDDIPTFEVDEVFLPDEDSRSRMDSMIEEAARRLEGGKNIHDQSLAATLRSMITNYEWALDMAHKVIEQVPEVS